MAKQKDLTPKRNAPSLTTPTGGKPASASNALLVRSAPDPDRYAAGVQVLQCKFAEMVRDAQVAIARRQLEERERLAKLAELLRGGLADGKPDSAYPADALAEGTEVEMEHTDTPAEAKEVAKDHLEESDEYYEHLAEMEKQLEKEAGEEREPKVDDHESAPADKMRPRAEMILFNREGVYAIDKGDYLLFPGGGIDDGEQPRDACIRETLEEANRHPINVSNAGVVESLWPEDSGNDFWDNSPFDGERTYFFLGLDAGDAGVTHADQEEFQLLPWGTVTARLQELIESEDQSWARRNNQERLRLVNDAKRLAKVQANLRPVKQAQAQPVLPTDMARQKGDPDVKAHDFVASLAQNKGMAPQPAPAAAAGAPAPTPNTAGPAPTGTTAPAGATAPVPKVADAASLMPLQQHLLFTPEGRLVARRLANRRFAFPTSGTGRRAPYESDIPFVPETGVPDQGYHGYRVGLHVGETEEVPEGYEAVDPAEALKDFYASMGLARNKQFQQLDRARARTILRYLRARKARETSAQS